MTEFDGSWEGTRRRQLASGADVTPRDRLDWLEEAVLLAYRAGALPRPRDAEGNLLRPRRPKPTPRRISALGDTRTSSRPPRP